MENETTYTGWIGTVASVIGSFVVAMQFMLIGYCLFIIGSVSWLYIGIVRRDKALMVLNGCFMVANLIGLYNAAI